MGKNFKITEEQYNKLCEWESTTTVDSKKPETVIQATRNNLSNAASQALATNASAIEITDNSGTTNENLMTKKELVAEARKDWKKGTKVVKLSELLKK